VTSFSTEPQSWSSDGMRPSSPIHRTAMPAPTITASALKAHFISGSQPRKAHSIAPASSVFNA